MDRLYGRRTVRLFVAALLPITTLADDMDVVFPSKGLEGLCITFLIYESMSMFICRNRVL